MVAPPADTVLLSDQAQVSAVVRGRATKAEAVSLHDHESDAVRGKHALLLLW